MAVTSKPDVVTKKRDGVTENVVTSSRAHAPYGGMSQCHSHTAVTVACDSDRSALKLRPITVTPDTAVAGKQEVHKNRLAADPRFALWAAMDTAPGVTPVTCVTPVTDVTRVTPNLGPMADPVYSDVARRHTERNELRRVAAVSALRNGGKHLTPQQVAVNRFWAGLSALAGPLGDGEPA